MDASRKKASAAHERLMMNLAVFHLLLPVAALSTGFVLELLLISVVGSLMIIGWIAWKHKQIGEGFVHGHWLLAWKRCKLLLIAYAVSSLIMLFGLLLSLTQQDHNMGSIMLVVFSRIAAVPVVLMVLALFVMETTALSQALQGLEAFK